MMFTFNSELHEYRLNGQVIPSVTQIIETILPVWQAGSWYLGRGRAIHHACALSDRGMLDELTVDPEIAPRLAAWRKFLAESEAKIKEIEIPLVHETYRFAGTIDRVLEYQGDSVVADIKSSISPQVQVQLGFYSILLTATGKRVTRGAAIELRDEGDYRVLWLNNRELRLAEQTAKSVLTVFNFMFKHKLSNLRSSNHE